MCALWPLTSIDRMETADDREARLERERLAEQRLIQAQREAYLKAIKLCKELVCSPSPFERGLCKRRALDPRISFRKYGHSQIHRNISLVLFSTALSRNLLLKARYGSVFCACALEF